MIRYEKNTAVCYGCLKGPKWYLCVWNHMCNSLVESGCWAHVTSKRNYSTLARNAMYREYLHIIHGISVSGYILSSTEQKLVPACIEQKIKLLFPPAGCEKYTEPPTEEEEQFYELDKVAEDYHREVFKRQQEEDYLHNEQGEMIVRKKP